MGLSLFFVCVFCVDPNKSPKNTSEKLLKGRKVYKVGLQTQSFMSVCLHFLNVFFKDH